MTNNWPISEPDSLEDLCVQACVNNVQTLAVKTDDQQLQYELKPGVCLLVPSLCDKLFKNLLESQPENKTRDLSTLFTSNAPYLPWLRIFADTENTRLCKVYLRKSLLHNIYPSNLIELVLNHPLKQLELVNCSFSCDIFNLISSSKAGHSLLSLSIEDSVDSALKKHFKVLDLQPGDTIPHIKLECPHLQRLVLRDMREHDLGLLPGCEIVHLFSQLTHLDLSRCILSSTAVKSMMQCQNLVWLNLNCVEFPSHADFVTSICRITKLRHLDISSDAGLSQCNYPNSSTFNPELILTTLVSHLPHLVSLDISATNLAGRDTVQRSFKLEAKGAGDCKDSERCCIPGLEGRHFEFLGLYNCPFESYRRENIPAKQITGSKNEEQLLLALRRYVDRRDDLNDVLNHLFTLFKEETVINQSVALEGILAAMKRHKDDKHIQISGSASLFYIMKGEQKLYITQKQKRVLINCLLEGMEDPEADNVMIRNCCLTLCHLTMPQDVLHCYRRMISTLLNLNHEDGQEEFIQRITLYMINHLACQVDGEEKKVVGDLGAIQIMLDTIQNRLNENNCDEIMEMAWSTMWNVTDETAINCDRFMEHNGMSLFIECLETFPEKPELLRNMMGLMGNIAEVPYLRPKLMEKSFIEIFCELLDSEKDGIEVSYNSAGVFSHMMADGPTAWTIQSPSRDHVTEKVISAIQRWPLKSTRNINYRSFTPILKIVDAYHALGAQYWAVWALCNLTTVYPQKYCPLLKKEGGEERITSILHNSKTIVKIKELAHKIIKNLNTDPDNSNEPGDSENSDLED
ncbi:protein zer-1 homolog [Mytilus trossulus]|uniref:protein zer-1 homolog n=1 Tax=Mytilus trossulus TaxID=6551 RepID=UPI0030045C2D